MQFEFTNHIYSRKVYDKTATFCSQRVMWEEEILYGELCDDRCLTDESGGGVPVTSPGGSSEIFGV